MLDTLAASAPDDPIQWRGVAVVDRDVPDTELERMHALGVRGIRINLVFRGGISSDDVMALADRIAPAGWHVQLLIDVSRFERLGERLAGLPVPFVVDHMGHVPAERGPDDPGFQTLAQLLADGQGWVKLTGPNRTSALPGPPFTDVAPFFDALRKARPDRCLFGTDWPHVQLPGPMPNDAELVDEFLHLVPDPAERRTILVDNPARLYGFPETL
ncbi:MAG: amidohydrolase family protein [Arhodomonas sp.]|nr:amidohydrolase family protein [Arhodomonas sp.]